MFSGLKLTKRSDWRFIRRKNKILVQIKQDGCKSYLWPSSLIHKELRPQLQDHWDFFLCKHHHQEDTDQRLKAKYWRKIPSFNDNIDNESKNPNFTTTHPIMETGPCPTDLPSYPSGIVVNYATSLLGINILNSNLFMYRPSKYIIFWPSPFIW